MQLIEVFTIFSILLFFLSQKINLKNIILHMVLPVEHLKVATIMLYISKNFLWFLLLFCWQISGNLLQHILPPHFHLVSVVFFSFSSATFISNSIYSISDVDDSVTVDCISLARH